MKVSWTTALILLLMPVFSLAQPALRQPEMVNGFRVYPDCKDDSLFYYPPAGIRLKSNGPLPEFSFQRVRYTGTSQLGDAGAFRVNGYLRFTIEFDSPHGRLDSIRKGLERRGIARPGLLPVPLAGIESVLVYDLVSKGETGSIAGGQWSGGDLGQGQSWSSRTFRLELDALSTDLLWQAYENGAVVLSVGVNALGQGVDFRERDHGQPPKEIRSTVFADSLAIDVEFDEENGLFSSTDLDAKMPAGYTYLTVYCHDFSEEFTVDHVRVIVEVRGTAVNGDHPLAKAGFSSVEPDEFRKQIHFEYAMNLDAGFQYRVIKINRFGELNAGEWQSAENWSGVLNVSSQPGTGLERAARDLDPRELY